MNSLFRSRSGTQHNISFEIAVRCTQNTYALRTNHYSYLSQQGSCSEYNVLAMQRLHAPPTRLSSRVSLRSPLQNNIFSSSSSSSLSLSLPPSLPLSLTLSLSLSLSLSLVLYTRQCSIIKDTLQNTVFALIVIALTFRARYVLFNK